MARIRTIKPTIWTDDAFIELTHAARLLLIGMITQADDEGRFIASSSSLIGAIYPHDDVTPKQVEKWRDEVAASGIVTLYQAGRATYGYFPKWLSHQVINKRSSSTLPTPPLPDGSHTTTVANTVVRQESLPTGSGSGKGDRKEEGETTAAATPLAAVEEPDRPDVEAICLYFSDALAMNGVTAKVTAKWRTEARLMLDRDNRDPELIREVIDWTAADSFWRANILSIPKLREKFDRLRLAMESKTASAPVPEWKRLGRLGDWDV